MLIIAVLCCRLFQDDGTASKRGKLEVSGSIAGVTERKKSAGNALPAPEQTIAPKDGKEKEARDIAAAKVKVLALAKAAAEKNMADKKKPEADPVSPALGEGKAVPAVSSEKKASASEYSPAEAAPRLASAESPSSAPRTTAGEQASAVPVKADQPLPEKKASPESVSKAGKAAVQPPVKKSDKTAAMAQPRKTPKAEARKNAPAAKPAEKAVPRGQLSAVEAALADARAGRLAPDKSAPVEKKLSGEYDRVVTSAKFVMKGSLIKLVLRGNAPMVGHFYVLESPDRVVLDLAGNWKIEVPRVPSNRLIGSVRVGQHEDKTRLVFDMKNTGKVALVPLNRNALELRIQ